MADEAREDGMPTLKPRDLADLAEEQANLCLPLAQSRAVFWTPHQ